MPEIKANCCYCLPDSIKIVIKAVLWQQATANLMREAASVKYVSESKGRRNSASLWSETGGHMRSYSPGATQWVHEVYAAAHSVARLHGSCSFLVPSTQFQGLFSKVGGGMYQKIQRQEKPSKQRKTVPWHSLFRKAVQRQSSLDVKHAER